jgi:hypothetical protein
MMHGQKNIKLYIAVRLMLIASGLHCRDNCSALHIQQYYFCLIECRSVSTTSTFKNAEEIPSVLS